MTSQSPPTTAFFTRAIMSTLAHPPWQEFLFVSLYFPRRLSFGETTSRMKRNLNNFRVNYAKIMGFLLLSLIRHPISMIFFLAVFVAWCLLYFFRDNPLVILNRQIDERVVLAILAVSTIVSLVLTDVWLHVLVSVLVGAFIVAIHAACSATEDLYSDQLDGSEGGLLSIVGGLIGARYTPV